MGTLGSRLYPQLTVRESGILKVLIAHILKLLATIAGTHGIELYDNETQLGQRSGLPVVRREALRRIGIAGPCVDILDNGVLTGRIEIGGPLNDTPHIGLAITSLGFEHLRCHPSVGGQPGDVGRLQSLEQPTVLTTAQHSDRRKVDTRVGVDKVTVV